LLQELQIGFILLAHPGSPRRNPESRKTFVVVIVVTNPQQTKPVEFHATATVADPFHGNIFPTGIKQFFAHENFRIGLWDINNSAEKNKVKQ